MGDNGGGRQLAMSAVVTLTGRCADSTHRCATTLRHYTPAVPSCPVLPCHSIYELLSSHNLHKYRQSVVLEVFPKFKARNGKRKTRLQSLSVMVYGITGTTQIIPHCATISRSKHHYYLITMGKWLFLPIDLKTNQN